MTNKEIIVPFQGYYNSLYDDLLEDVTELQDFETGEPLAYDDNINWCGMKEVLNKIYIEEFQDLFNSETGLNIKLTYKDMESPREYNFSTDRLFCTISDSDIKALHEYATGSQSTFAGVIQERFTSYDGFISFYSNDVLKWIEKPINTYDHNELETLLLAALAQECDYSEFEQDLYELVRERAICNGELDLIFNKD